ncbi:MAG: tyrosine-type recombinase/integrase [Terriglobia bacterium]|jgi:integrase
MNSLRVALQDYLSMRRGLGFKLQKDGKCLLKFVTFLEQQNAPYITTRLGLEWAQQTVSTSGWQWQRLRMVRGFAKYRSATDSRTEIPPSTLLPRLRHRARPYIYTEDEIQRLLDAVIKRKFRNHFNAKTYYCLLGLLAVAGLRSGEAIRLKCEDVDLINGVLVIRGTKFGKSRLVPLHPSTQKVLRDYQKRRESYLAGRPVAHFFISGRGTPILQSEIYRIFNSLSVQIGLRHPSAKGGPRPHDFRHRFAVHTLLRWYRSGLEIEPRLPLLSTFLGHVCITSTYWYLTANPELMGLAVKRLERRWGEKP